MVLTSGCSSTTAVLPPCTHKYYYPTECVLPSAGTNKTRVEIQCVKGADHNVYASWEFWFGLAICIAIICKYKYMRQHFPSLYKDIGLPIMSSKLISQWLTDCVQPSTLFLLGPGGGIIFWRCIRFTQCYKKCKDSIRHEKNRACARMCVRMCPCCDKCCEPYTRPTISEIQQHKG